MKTVVLYGSPRKDGNSATLTKYFLQGLRTNEINEIKEFYSNDLGISPCQMCGSCSKPERIELAPHNCIISDDMHPIYAAFAEANIIVFATPIIWGYMTAQLKTVLDRLEALASNKYFGHKTFVVIITCWHHYETLVSFFKRAIESYYEEVQLHTIIYCSWDQNSRNDRHVLTCNEKLQEAYELGRTVGKNMHIRIRKKR
ncbi:MAG: flavodoxin family protein [Candidatus Hodarchaeota archaeon]